MKPLIEIINTDNEPNIIDQILTTNTMIYANHLYNLATSKPRITMAEIEAMCLNKAKQGEMYCWVFNPIAEDDIEKLKTNGFEIERHNNSSYRIDWAKPTNL